MQQHHGIRHFLDRIRDEQVNKLCDIFSLSNVSVDSLLDNDIKQPELLTKQLEITLAKFAQFIEPMLEHKDLQRRESAVNLALEFLQLLGEVSEDFRALLVANNLLQANAQQVLQDQQLRQQLIRVLQYATDMRVMRQLHVDLLNRLRAVLQQAHAAQSSYVEGLKRAVDPQRKAAADDLSNMAKHAVDSANSNAMFDPHRRIGQLLAILYFTNYVLPFEKIYYPDLRPVVEKPDIKNNPFSKLNRERFGGLNNNVDVYPTDAPAPVQLPPGIKN